MSAIPQAPEIRLNDDGTLDEIVAKDDFFHLEQMDGNCWWLSVQRDGQQVDVWLRARGKITAHFERTEI
ncbi:MAG: hypothetical protein P4L10_11140 [Acidobacteriaceae bacterium]|nr:hypothetical protein [Acidobacteriaceae bacterium]